MRCHHVVLGDDVPLFRSETDCSVDIFQVVVEIPFFRPQVQAQVIVFAIGLRFSNRLLLQRRPQGC